MAQKFCNATLEGSGGGVAAVPDKKAKGLIDCAPLSLSSWTLKSTTEMRDRLGGIKSIIKQSIARF
jgi:hypothetical protein